jgi:DNA-binding phage protein
MSCSAKDYRAALLQALQDPQEAAAYLTAALEEGDRAVFCMALRDVADARGLETLRLSEDGNPQLESLTAWLDALELRLAIAVK